jgi:ABC-type transport system involved in multi-copper enzyme maturation permease subunit
MNWLLWKDYRHNRLIVFTALTLLLAPYLIAVVMMCVASCLQAVTHNVEMLNWRPQWHEAIAVAAIYSLSISQLSMALIGGNAISGERVDRSSQFLYSLPITRRRLLASKLLLALIVAAVVWLVSLAVFLLLLAVAPATKLPEDAFTQALTSAAYIATTGLTFFCVAWCLSSFVAHPAFDMCGGVLVPLAVSSGFAVVCDMRTQRELIGNCYLITCLVLSAVCFGIGAWHYLRRIEP